MCNFIIAKTGKQCKLAPSKDLCGKHNKTIVAEPIAEQKKEEELFEVETELVSEDIVPTMSPNTPASDSLPASSIVEETKIERIEINSSEIDVASYYRRIAALGHDGCFNPSVPSYENIVLTPYQFRQICKYAVSTPHSESLMTVYRFGIDRKIEIDDETKVIMADTIATYEAALLVKNEEEEKRSAAVAKSNASYAEKIAKLKQCSDYLSEHAHGSWKGSKCMLAKEKDGKRPYLYRHNKDMTLLRIEIDQVHRRFYWIYNPKDVRAFSEHVSLQLRLECHEVISVPRCRFFFDFDLKLDEMEKGDFSSAMGYVYTMAASSG